MDAMTRLRTSELASLLVEVLPADSEAMGLVRAKGRVRRKYDCTNMQFEEALCSPPPAGRSSGFSAVRCWHAMSE